MAAEWSSSGGCCSCCWWFWDSICCGCCECVRAITTQSTKEKRYAHIAYKEVKPDIDSGAVSGDALENESGEQKQLLKDDHDDDDDEYVLIPSPSAAPDDGDKNDSELSALDSGGSNSLPDCFSASPDALTAVKKSPCATRQAPPMVQGLKRSVSAPAAWKKFVQAHHCAGGATSRQTPIHRRKDRTDSSASGHDDDGLRSVISSSSSSELPVVAPNDATIQPSGARGDRLTSTGAISEDGNDEAEEEEEAEDPIQSLGRVRFPQHINIGDLHANGDTPQQSAITRQPVAARARNSIVIGSDDSRARAATLPAAFLSRVGSVRQMPQQGGPERRLGSGEVAAIRRHSIRPDASRRSSFLATVKPSVKSVPAFLEFSLFYDLQRSTLCVHILQAFNLPAKDRFGSSDPFVILYLLPNKECLFQTSVVKNTLNPVFNRMFEFKGISFEDIRHQTIVFLLYDHDYFTRNDELGGLSVSLQDMEMYGEKVSMPLQDDVVLQQQGKHSKGDLLVSLAYYPTTNQLKGIVLKATNLKKMDIIGKADPYVKITVYNQMHSKLKKWRSETRLNTLSPVFNEPFRFNIEDMDVNNFFMQLVVMDYDRFTQDDVIGVVHIGQSVESEVGRKHWSDVLSTPTQSVLRWHSIALMSFTQKMRKGSVRRSKKI